MFRLGRVAAGVWVVALAAPAAAQPVRLEAPIPSSRNVDPDWRPADAPRAEPAPTDDLPPRPARLRFAPEPTARAVSDRTLTDLRNAERDRERPPAKVDELFSYLADLSPNDLDDDVRPAGLRRAARDRDDLPPSRNPGATGGASGGSATSGGDKWFSGDRLKRIFGRGSNGLFCSDAEFDEFISPVSNPFLFEDPRSLTEVRGQFLYQNVPRGQPNFQGGNVWFGGLQGRLAFNDRISLVVHKIGAVGVNTSGASLFGDNTGLSELWLGPKFVLVRDKDTRTLVSAGAQFHIPLGSSDVFQDTGSLSIVPYVSAGKNFLKTDFGSLNALGTVGYSVSTSNKRSDYIYASAHLSLDVLNKQKFYPLVEVNWFQVTTNGTSRFVAGEGRDVINFGGRAKGSNLLTAAVGARWKITKSIELGGAYELPVSGNRDLFRQRFLVDLIWRY